ncbi:MAG: DUF1360 domain-containing protein [Bacteroidales bacterium]|nr:DUF1360 domain-containing protein [Bacteroidales bacterium]
MPKGKNMDNPKQNAINFTSLFIYLAFLILAGFMMKSKGLDLRDISVREIIILILASYRLTRILVFEKILKFLRDFVKSKKSISALNTVRYIITCPWCAGVWVTLVIAVLYFLVPYGVFLVYILAISGVASFIVLLANLLGLKIEEKQSAVHPKKDS